MRVRESAETTDQQTRSPDAHRTLSHVVPLSRPVATENREAGGSVTEAIINNLPSSDANHRYRVGYSTVQYVFFH
jgi:hypothetical protein